MPDPPARHELAELPDEEAISSLREQAQEQGASVEARFPTADGKQKRLVVSPRGTVVLLNDVSKDTFNRSVSASDVATALREQL